MAEMAMQGEYKPDQAHYAGFWVRFFSVCIDMVICTPLYYGLCKLLNGYNRWYGDGAFILVSIAYYGLFFSSRWQATPGMRLLKVYITDTHGARVSFRRGLYWLISSMFLWAICFAGIIYLQSRVDIVGVQDLQESCLTQNIDPKECDAQIESLTHIPMPTFNTLIWVSLLLFLFMSAIWALSIALPKDKTGFHNLMCGTRFLKGRAENGNRKFEI